MADENERIEYKKSLSQLREGIISLSSMLNKCGEGTVYFGIAPDRKPFKQAITKKTLSDISNETRSNLKPLPTQLDIDVIPYEGVDVIRVFAKGEDKPYSAYGRYYCRLVDGDIPMTNHQLQQYFEAMEDTYSRWEEKPTEYGFDDIDEDLLIDAIRQANDKGRLSYVFRSSEEAMRMLDLVTADGRIKTAGYYLFGKGKPITVKEAIFPTDSKTEFGEIKEFKGNVFECIQETVSYIQNHISYKSEIVGIQRQETPEIPLQAIREIVINSFAHSKYEAKGDFNEVSIYKSSVRIYNPGPIYRNIDPKRFASAEVGSKIRNVLIASVLYKCGYIDAFGTGFGRTFAICDKNGVEYDYLNDEFGFAFAFARNPDFLIESREAQKQERWDPLDRLIVREIAKNNFITIPELSAIAGKSNPTIYRHIEAMRKMGILTRMESRKSGYWEIAKKYS